MLAASLCWLTPSFTTTYDEGPTLQCIYCTQRYDSDIFDPDLFKLPNYCWLTPSFTTTYNDSKMQSWYFGHDHIILRSNHCNHCWLTPSSTTTYNVGPIFTAHQRYNPDILIMITPYSIPIIIPIIVIALYFIPIIVDWHPPPPPPTLT